MISTMPYADVLSSPRVRDLAPSGFVAEHSLLKTATPGQSSSRWLSEGVQFTPTLCKHLDVQEINDVCTDFDGPPTYQTPPEGPLTFAPFIVEIATEQRTTCAVGMEGEWLSERLVLGLSQKIEAHVWTDLVNGTSVDGGAAGSAAAAFGRIEDAILGATAGAGTIHMAPSLAVTLADYLIPYPDGGLRSKGTGSKIVIGNYAPTHIAGHIGNMDLYLGSSIYYDRMTKRDVNYLFEHAWIEAAVAWHTCSSWVAPVSSAAASGGLQSRQTASMTTASLADAANQTGTITLAPGYRLLNVTTNVPARVRLYTTIAARDADISRATGILPDTAIDHGVMSDVVTVSGDLTRSLSPSVDGYVDGPGSSVPWTVTNLSGSTSAVTVTFTWIKTEV